MKVFVVPYPVYPSPTWFPLVEPANILLGRWGGMLAKEKNKNKETLRQDEGELYFELTPKT